VSPWSQRLVQSHARNRPDELRPPVARPVQEGAEPAGLIAARALLAGAPVIEEARWQQVIQEALGVAMLIHCPTCGALQAQELAAKDGCIVVYCNHCGEVRGADVRDKACRL
jgi:hypothetical protein